MSTEVAGLITHTSTFVESLLISRHVFLNVIFAWLFLLWEIGALTFYKVQEVYSHNVCLLFPDLYAGVCTSASHLLVPLQAYSRFWNKLLTPESSSQALRQGQPKERHCTSPVGFHETSELKAAAAGTQAPQGSCRGLTLHADVTPRRCRRAVCSHFAPPAQMLE